MAKEKTIKRIGVVLVPRNILDTDPNGKPLRENTMWFGLNNEDYFFPTGVTVYEASTQKKTCSLSTNPELIKMISRSGVEHSFYVDDTLVEDMDAINTAIENIK
jgi:hypothetical protein